MSNASFHETDFQDTIVGYLWRTIGAMSKYVDLVKPAFFEDASTSTVFLELSRYYRDHKKIPAFAVLIDALNRQYPEKENDAHARSRRTLRNKLNFISDCDISDAVYIEKQIKEFIQHSALLQFATETVNNIASRTYDPDLPKKAREALMAGEVDEDLGHDWTQSVSQRIYNATSPNYEPRVPTGIAHLDALISGGLKAGELGILLGLPKGFKSGTLLNFAFSAMKVSNGLNVLYITLELDAELVGLRFDFRCANRTKEQLLADPEKFKKVLLTRMDVMLGPNRLFIKQFRTKTATVDTIAHYIERVEEHYGLKIGLVIVDYLDLLKATRKREKSYQEDVDICEDLRDTAGRFRIPIWTACIQYDQSVLTNEGPIKIGRIGKRLRSGVPLLALSFNFSTGKNEWKPIVNWFDNGINEENFVRIKTDADAPKLRQRSSPGATTTKAHHYFTPTGLKIEAGALHPGDSVMTLGYRLSKDQFQVALGSLMGDASLRGKRRSMSITHGDTQSYYIQWKQRVFAGLDTNLITYTAKACSINGNQTGPRICWQLEVSGCGELNDLYKHFYPAGQKVVPRQLIDQLSPLGLAVWFMDDGGIHKRDRTQTSLYTNGFTYEDCRFLVTWFRQKWGLSATINSRNTLTFTAASSRQLLGIIAPYLQKSKQVGISKEFLCQVTQPGFLTGIPRMVTKTSEISFHGKKAEKRKRFDLEVADNHNYYLSSGALVSNCRATRDAVGKKRISMAHMSRAFERVGVADLMIALCQSEKEKAEKIIRLYLAATRNDEGEKMVLCKVDYPRMLLTSQAIIEPEYDEDESKIRAAKRKAADKTDWDAAPVA